MSNIIQLPGVPVHIVPFLQELLKAAEAGEIKGLVGAMVTKDDGLVPLWTPMDATTVYLAGGVIQDHGMSVLRGNKPMGYEQVRPAPEPPKPPKDYNNAPDFAPMKGTPRLRVVEEEEPK